MISLSNYKFIGLAILLGCSMLLTSSLAEANNKGRTTKPAPIKTHKCDRTVSSHIQDLCEAYYSSDCQSTTTEAQGSITEAQSITTEAPALPVYDCKILSKLVDPLFNSDTATMAQTIMTFYKKTVKATADGKTIDSVFDALKVLCKRFTQFGFYDCIKEPAPEFQENIAWSSAYSTACNDYFEEEFYTNKIIEKFYVPECMITKIKQAKETCSALYNNGCLADGSSLNVTCLP